ncbi:anionic trypsin-2 [Scaptodrosophila lebanonensis]|uniref:trypsin n=1 Tax=Drosophila lebanonensis TaxID=7225 RepID=A0A6J2U731_DROLE|nr:anionic trypsin-2 [Scaptodrosophila lebanonensis]
MRYSLHTHFIIALFAVLEQPASSYINAYRDRIKDIYFNYITQNDLDQSNTDLAATVVSLRTPFSIGLSGGTHFCAGVLASQDTVLTSAHCVTDRNGAVVRTRRVVVVAGSPYRLRNLENEYFVEVKSIKLHPLYRRQNFHDIAVIQLTREVPLSKFIATVTIGRLVVKPGKRCVALGWGRLYEYGPKSNELLFIDAKILPLDDCLETYLIKKTIEEANSDANLCVKSMEPECEWCEGDRGSPVFCDNFLYGIAMGHLNCSRRGPTIFTHVPFHTDWIFGASRAAKNCRLVLHVSVIAWQTFTCLTNPTNFAHL